MASLLNLRGTVTPYPLELRHAFGTSHSRTQTRCNALVTLTLGGGAGNTPEIQGWGEAGLPPFKAGVYEGTLESCGGGLEAIFAAAEGKKTIGVLKGKVQSSLGPGYQSTPFWGCLDALVDGDRLWSVARLLSGLHSCSEGLGTSGAPLCAALECAALTLFGEVLGLRLGTLIGVNDPQIIPRGLHGDGISRGFYTIGMQESEAAILESLAEAKAHTQYLKLKLSSDLQHAAWTLKTVEAHVPGDHLDIVVDANCSWNPKNTLAFLALCKEHPRIKMVEQPFPSTFSEILQGSNDARVQWQEVAVAYKEAGILLVADESFHGAHDVHNSCSYPAPDGCRTHGGLSLYCTGVNLKLEKAGGILNGCEAARLAHSSGLALWVGCMVSSSLACSPAALFVTVTSMGGDVDGPLLIKPTSDLFEACFEVHDGVLSLSYPEGRALVAPKP